MEKKTLIKTISLPVEMVNFLDENPSLSLSKITQSKINEIIESRRFNYANMASLKRQNEILQQNLWSANDNVEIWRQKYNELLAEKTA